MTMMIMLLLMVITTTDNNEEVVLGGGGGVHIFANAFSTTSSSSFRQQQQQQSPTWERRRQQNNKENHQENQNKWQDVGPVVVVGKIIIDEYYYQSPLLDDKDDSSSERETTILEKKEEKEETKKITIGGGGPQAAWGAAAALAVMEQMEMTTAIRDNETNTTTREDRRPSNTTATVPPKQSVAFLGPVGNANGLVEDIQNGLKEILGPAVDTIQLVVAPNLQTPTIQLWHDGDQQDIQWKPLNDCWGQKGADALWRNRPSAKDILQLLDDDSLSFDHGGGEHDKKKKKRNSISNLHMIMEMGASAAGGGQDCEFLLDAELMSRVSHLCIEPIAFPQEVDVEDDENNNNGNNNNDDDDNESTTTTTTIMAISHADVLSSLERLELPHHSSSSSSSKMRNNNNTSMMVVPDSHLVEAWIKYGYLQEMILCQQVSEVVGRFGPSGSRVYYPSADVVSETNDKTPTEEKKKEEDPSSSSSEVVDYIQVPTATLETSNGKPVNPTGAGNAYSAALSTCRSRGWSLEESACLATAVGATFCEYEHLPPWTWEVLNRIQRGTLEVYDAIFI